MAGLLSLLLLAQSTPRHQAQPDRCEKTIKSTSEIEVINSFDVDVSTHNSTERSEGRVRNEIVLDERRRHIYFLRLE